MHTACMKTVELAYTSHREMSHRTENKHTSTHPQPIKKKKNGQKVVKVYTPFLIDGEVSCELDSLEDQLLPFLSAFLPDSTNESEKYHVSSPSKTVKHRITTFEVCLFICPLRLAR